MDVSSLLSPDECPLALREWFEQTYPQGKRTVGRKRTVAGFRWDGVSAEIVLILAPKGKTTRRIPSGVWEKMD